MSETQRIYNRFMYTLLTSQRELVQAAKHQLGIRGWRLFGGHYRLIARVIWETNGLVDPMELEKLPEPAQKCLQAINASIVEYDSDPTEDDIKKWAKVVKEAYVSHVMIKFDAVQAQQLREKKITADKAVRDKLKFLQDLQSIGTGSDSLRSMGEITPKAIGILDGWFEGDTTKTHVKTGFAIVDKYTDGLPRGEVTVIAAPTGVGKTALADKIAYQVATNLQRTGRNACAIYESMEMSGEKLYLRIASAMARVNLQDIKAGRIKKTDPDGQKLLQCAKRLQGSPCEIGDNAGLTPSQIGERAQMALGKYDAVDLIVLDYAGLAQSDDMSNNEIERLESVFYGMKYLAENFKNPDGTKPAVIVITAFSRGITNRSNPLPSMTDMKYAGDYAAALALFPFNVYEHRHNEEVKKILSPMKIHPDELNERDRWLVVPKNREGWTGIIPHLQFWGEYTSWEQKAVNI